MTVNQAALKYACEFYKADIILEIMILAPVDTGKLVSGIDMDISIDRYGNVSFDTYSHVNYYSIAMERHGNKIGKEIVASVVDSWTPMIRKLALEYKDGIKRQYVRNLKNEIVTRSVKAWNSKR